MLGNGHHAAGNTFTNVFFVGGLPLTIQTYDLSLGTALFEHRFNGLVRNMRALNCSSPFLARLSVIASQGLKFLTDSDPCLLNPCLHNGVCSLADDTFDCDCSYTNYEGKYCEKCKYIFCLFVYLLKKKGLGTFIDYGQFTIVHGQKLSMDNSKWRCQEFSYIRQKHILRFFKITLRVQKVKLK